MIFLSSFSAVRREQQRRKNLQSQIHVPLHRKCSTSYRKMEEERGEGEGRGRGIVRLTCYLTRVCDLLFAVSLFTICCSREYCSANINIKAEVDFSPLLFVLFRLSFFSSLSLACFSFSPFEFSSRVLPSPVFGACIQVKASSHSAVCVYALVWIIIPGMTVIPQCIISNPTLPRQFIHHLLFPKPSGKNGTANVLYTTQINTWSSRYSSHLMTQSTLPLIEI